MTNTEIFKEQFPDHEVPYWIEKVELISHTEAVALDKLGIQLKAHLVDRKKYVEDRTKFGREPLDVFEAFESPILGKHFIYFLGTWEGVE